MDIKILRFKHSWGESFFFLFPVLLLCLIISGCSGENSGTVETTHGKGIIGEHEVGTDTSVVVPWNEVGAPPGDVAERIASPTTEQSDLTGFRVDVDEIGRAHV